MKKFAIVAVFIAIGASYFVIGQPALAKSRISGKYIGSLSGPEPKGDQPLDQIVKRGKEALDAFLKMDLDLRRDGTYELKSLATIDGSWSVRGNTVTLHPLHVAGLEIQDKKDKFESDSELKVEGTDIVLREGSDANQVKYTFRRAN